MVRAAHNYQTIHQTLDSLAPGRSFLDLGAGDGRNALRYANLGATVTATDVRPCPAELTHDRITWVRADIRDFANRHEKYDAIFAINLIQFLEKEFVRTKFRDFLTRSLRPGGTCALRAFRGQPTPSFEGSAFASFWNCENLVEMLQDFQVISKSDYDREGTDYRGNKRTFRLTECIATRV